MAKSKGPRQEPPPNPILEKTRKVTGDISERATIGATPLVGKPTDFRFAVDRDLGKLVTIFAQKWADEQSRLAAVTEFRAVTSDLKRRADRSGYALLSEVCLLFIDYLAQVPPATQDEDAINNYLDAISVI